MPSKVKTWSRRPAAWPPAAAPCASWRRPRQWRSTGKHLLSLSSLDTILEVDRATGPLARSHGQLDDSVALDDDTSAFNHQHGSDFTESDTLGEVWRHVPDDRLEAVALGEAHHLDSGSTLVNLGSAGALHEVSADGELLWQASPHVGESWDGPA
jgi:hypothetical protein